jgi:hypothetical protein
MNLSLGIGVLLVAIASLSFIVSAEASSNTQVREKYERKLGRVNINVERGVRITLENRTSGRITVKGWDRDVIEAHAVSSRGDEVVIVGSEFGNGKLFLKADYADLDRPDAPTTRVGDPPEADGINLKVHFELNVPRYTEIELIEVIRSDVQVSDVDTLIAISGRHSSVILNRVGAADIRTREGNVEINHVNGLAAVTTSSGAIRISNAKEGVRAVSIAGPIEIKCSTGRIDVANTDAPIELINIDSDVDAIATNSSVRFTGRLRDEGRYYLKSMGGRVEMVLPTNTRGFDATLYSYRGLIETDFNLESKQASPDGPVNRRRVGHFGKGKAQITLDSFEGFVRLTKVAPESLASCP